MTMTGGQPSSGQPSSSRPAGGQPAGGRPAAEPRGAGRTSRRLTRSAGFAGVFLLPGDPGYDAARRVWNGMHDRRPAAIARCRNAADVAVVLRYAQACGVTVTVRGGGHNVSGTAIADDAVMIDLSLMRGVTVDADARVAVAAGGCLLRDLDAATTPLGLACPAGVVSHTGLAGLTLGGGYGWLARKWGLTCDHLLEAEVVLATGEIVRASEETNPELLWALRGGGGNFGVVTRFRLRLRPVGPMFYRSAIFSLTQAAAVLAWYREFSRGQPDEVHAVGAFKTAGHQEWIPQDLRGSPVLAISAIATDPAGLRPGALGDPGQRPAALTERIISYADLQKLADYSEPHGHRYYTRSCYLTDLSSEVAGELVAAADGLRSPLSAIDFEYLRGAIATRSPSASAFPRRDAPYMCTFSGHWIDSTDDSINIGWTRESSERISPFSYVGGYVNYTQDQGAGSVAEIYGTEIYQELSQVKARYDPDNTFFRNQNICPAR